MLRIKYFAVCRLIVWKNGLSKVPIIKINELLIYKIPAINKIIYIYITYFIIP